MLTKYGCKTLCAKVWENSGFTNLNITLMNDLDHYQSQFLPRPFNSPGTQSSSCIVQELKPRLMLQTRDRPKSIL